MQLTPLPKKRAPIPKTFSLLRHLADESGMSEISYGPLPIESDPLSGFPDLRVSLKAFLRLCRFPKSCWSRGLWFHPSFDGMCLLCRRTVESLPSSLILL